MLFGGVFISGEHQFQSDVLQEPQRAFLGVIFRADGISAAVGESESNGLIGFAAPVARSKVTPRVSICTTWGDSAGFFVARSASAALSRSI